MQVEDKNDQSKSIQAGIVSNVTSLLKSTINTIFKGFDSLMQFDDMTLKDIKDIKGEVNGEERVGREFLYEMGSGESLEIYLFAIEDNEDKFMIRIVSDKYDTFEKGPITTNEIEKYVTQYADKYDLGGIKDYIDINSSKRLQLKLQKVTSSNDISINLTAINANYDAELAVSNLNTLLNNDEFVNSISDDPCCYEIIDSEDEFDISTIDDFSVSDTCACIIDTAMKMWCNLSVIHWAAIGKDLNDLLNICENFKWRLMQEIEFFGELSVEFDNKVANPGISTSTDNIPPIINNDGTGFTSEFGLELISRMAETYLSVLDIYYVNFSHDIQNWLDNEIRVWKKDINYYIKQKLK